MSMWQVPTIVLAFLTWLPLASGKLLAMRARKRCDGAATIGSFADRPRRGNLTPALPTLPVSPTMSFQLPGRRMRLHRRGPEHLPRARLKREGHMACGETA
jgi:hypothetical protein